MVNSLQAGPGIIERTPEPAETGYVCEDCLSPVRFDIAAMAFFHALGTGFRELETEARHVKPAYAY